MFVHPPDKLKNNLDYLNNSGVVFHRDNGPFFQKEKPDRGHTRSNIPVVERSLSGEPKIIKKCLFCTTVITNNQYKVLGKRTYLCSII